jgi:hypothetical protein
MSWIETVTKMGAFSHKKRAIQADDQHCHSFLKKHHSVKFKDILQEKR